MKKKLCTNTWHVFNTICKVLTKRT